MPPKRKAKDIEPNTYVEDEHEGEANHNIEGRHAYSDFTCAGLKAELENRGLRRAGNKEELIARLVDSDAHRASILAAAAARGGEGTAKRKKTQTKMAERQVFGDPELDGPTAEEVVGYQHVDEHGQWRPGEFVPAPDDDFVEKLQRIRRERMFMLDRAEETTDNGPCQHYTIAGSKGNVYHTTIATTPKCDCPNFKFDKHRKCKHINYALIKILKAPMHLCYQRGFFAAELQTMFENAPLTQLPSIELRQEVKAAGATVRRPVEGKCAICVCDFEDNEALVWCAAACGQNFHAECFEQWRVTKARKGDALTCVYCRQPWKEPPPEQGQPGDDVQGGDAARGDDQKVGYMASAKKKGWYMNIGHTSLYAKES